MKKILLATLAICFVLFYASCKKDAPVTPPTKTPVTPSVDSLKIGLVAWYPFNNSGADSSGTGNDVYAYYGVTSTTNRANKANSAFYFDGRSTYMVIKDKASLRLNGTDFSFNLWVSLDSYNSSYGAELLCKRGQGNNNGWNYSITGQADQLNNILVGTNCYQVSGGSDPYAVGTKLIGIQQWHMLTTVYSAQKLTVSYYIDGVLDNVTNNIPSPRSTAASDLFIGQDSQNMGNTAYYLKGKLDDVRIYNRALPLSQIQKLYALTD